MIKTCLAALSLMGIAAARPTAAPAQVEIQIFGGTAASLPLPITISQNGQPDLRFTAHWSTRPTRPAWYYAWRVGLWNNGRGWRLDHTHHKLLLDNRPSEVATFRITNGFNILSLSRAFRNDNLTYSFGAGPVIAFPFSTVRGREFEHDKGWGGCVPN